MDLVFKQALREFKDNLVATYSVANRHGDTLNIKYKDLIGNFIRVSFNFIFLSIYVTVMIFIFIIYRLCYCFTKTDSKKKKSNSLMGSKAHIATTTVVDC